MEAFMFRRLVALLLVAAGVAWAFGTVSAEAGDRFTFGLSIWGPPPFQFGPPCCYEPYYPPPVVYRRVYVAPRPEPVYVVPATAPSPVPAPASARRSKLAHPVLVRIGELHSDDTDTREDAAEWLGDSHDPRAVRPLIEVMQHDRKDDVREAAAKSLGQIGGPDAERALTIASTSDRDDDVRRTASKALTRMAKQATQKLVR
jgi:hypothetical protein